MLCLTGSLPDSPVAFLEYYYSSGKPVSPSYELEITDFKDADHDFIGPA
jgi:hypothetical protein